jgi:hypothetical protein
MALRILRRGAGKHNLLFEPNRATGVAKVESIAPSLELFSRIEYESAKVPHEVLQ